MMLNLILKIKEENEKSKRKKENLKKGKKDNTEEIEMTEEENADLVESVNNLMKFGNEMDKHIRKKALCINPIVLIIVLVVTLLILLTLYFSK